jgi:phosphoglycolate phosphatase
MSSSRTADGAYGAVIFDLDGTLIDSRASTHAALLAAVRIVLGAGVPELSFDLSLPLDGMILAAVPGRTEDEYARLGQAFRAEYDAAAWRLAVAYPGASVCLARLAAGRIRVFVVTNKRETAARRILRHLELDSSISEVFGQPDDAAGVEKLALAQRCLADAQLSPSDIVVVGDSDQDAQMARGLGAPFIAIVNRDGPLSHDPVRHGSIQELWELPDLVGAADGRVA